MKLRVLNGSYNSNRLAIELTNDGKKATCLMVQGMSQKGEIRFQYKRVPSGRLTDTIKKGILMIRLEACGISNTGDVKPMHLWEGPYPKGWDIRKYYTSFIAKVKRKYYRTWRDVENGGWILDRETTSILYRKWDKMAPALTSEYITEGHRHMRSISEAVPMLGKMVQEVKDGT